MSDIPESPGGRKPIPHIFLTRTESDALLTCGNHQSPDDIPLVDVIEPDGRVANSRSETPPESDDDATKDVTSSLIVRDGDISEEEEAALNQLDEALGQGYDTLNLGDGNDTLRLGDGRDTLRIDSLDIDIPTAHTFKRVESGATSPVMAILRSSFGKVQTFKIMKLKFSEI